MKVISQLKKCKFFSVLLDGSTDSGNVENELIMAVWFNPEGADEKVCTTISYFRISQPSSTTAQGLFDLLRDSKEQIMGIKVAVKRLSGGRPVVLLNFLKCYISFFLQSYVEVYQS